MFERKKVSHSEGKKAGGNSTAIKMDIPSIDGLEVTEETAVEEEVVVEKKSFVSFFKNLSMGSSSQTKQSSVSGGGCGCFSK